MTQIFTPAANRIARVALVAAIGTLLGLLIVGSALQRSAFVTGVGVPVPQPTSFDHRRHAEIGLDCRFCHGTAEDAAFAGLPATQTCTSCHKLVASELPSLEPVLESLDTGKPLMWTRVHDLPQFVLFDHSVHLLAGVGCSTCHGRVDRMAVVTKQRDLHMGSCLDCHREPERFLRPREQLLDMNWEPPAEQSARGRALVHSHGVDTSGRRLLDCSTCHR